MQCPHSTKLSKTPGGRDERPTSYAVKVLQTNSIDLESVLAGHASTRRMQFHGVLLFMSRYMKAGCAPRMHTLIAIPFLHKNLNREDVTGV